METVTVETDFNALSFLEFAGGIKAAVESGEVDAFGTNAIYSNNLVQFVENDDDLLLATNRLKGGRYFLSISVQRSADDGVEYEASALLLIENHEIAGAALLAHRDEVKKMSNSYSEENIAEALSRDAESITEHIRGLIFPMVH